MCCIYTWNVNNLAVKPDGKTQTPEVEKGGGANQWGAHSKALLVLPSSYTCIFLPYETCRLNDVEQNMILNPTSIALDEHRDQGTMTGHKKWEKNKFFSDSILTFISVFPQSALFCNC